MNTSVETPRWLTFEDRRSEGWFFEKETVMAKGKRAKKPVDMIVVKNDSKFLDLVRNQKLIGVVFKRGVSDLRGIEIVKEMADYYHTPKNSTCFEIIKHYAQ